MSRVTVVLSQGHRLGAERQHREDELVARLLMSPQVEATIVGDLGRIDAASTDQLCLESIPHTAIVLAWYSTPQALEDLQRIGIDARLLNFAPNSNDETTPPLGKRHEFYYFDLNEVQPPEYFLNVVARVAEEADKSPIGLTNLVTGSEVPLATGSRNSNDRVDTTSATSVTPPRTNENAQQQDDSDERDELDDLMDAFDRVEL